ncbi:cation:proton antiporter [Neomoorella thermoacetica]|uniref:K(+)/H(+) antiporter YhaU n=2 Tax=Neomoorella thermoacetica TaxID=1525 RepID=A0A1J5JQC6_NEOTH|nr:cation:proton antiporter [Moorella thermoacetica]OIQ07664.1 K(+)/H(+) antiporter YhaU [Moorella thermoacetica]OIQ10439.1 K(+)/H(+) antiporter YhaU [Moorella thermoacetica]OIQ62580.1 K(+)/H(+) antiporter YhaU [Moorella thermoacetica]GAF25275.1 Kef-type K+ transport systems, membrane components [Moorella thermoacetica Y72]
MPEQVLLEIGLALAIVAFAGILAARFRVSIVPLLILAGMVVGPHAPVIGILDFRFIKSAPLIDFMGRVGILFLLFSLGLEFSVGRLLKAGRSILVGGSIYMAINFTLGMVLPIIWGWPLRETLVVAGLISISSSAIVAKVLVDLKRTARPETEMILGLMLFQDVFVAVYLSIISGLVLTGSASPASVLKSTSLALGFMLGLILAGRKLAPLINRLLNVPSDEVFMLIVFAFLTLVAGFSETIHVAEAIGALLVGLILAETDHLDRIEHIVVPFRDFFGALFFFSFGLSIDPLTLGGAVGPVLTAVAATLTGNFLAGILAGRMAGYSYRGCTNIGLTITPRGEFSIILANLAKTGGLLPVLQPFAALYVLLMAILGPLLTKESKWIYNQLAHIFGWPALKETNKPRRPV